MPSDSLLGSFLSGISVQKPGQWFLLCDLGRRANVTDVVFVQKCKAQTGGWLSREALTLD